MNPNPPAAPVTNSVLQAMSDDYEKRCAAIESEYRQKLDALMKSAEIIQNDFRSSFARESEAASSTLKEAVEQQVEKLQSSMRRGLLGFAGAIITIGLIAFAAVYQTAQTQVLKSGADFQRELAGAYKEISAARLAASGATTDIEQQKSKLEAATKSAEVEAKRLQALPVR